MATFFKDWNIQSDERVEQQELSSIAAGHFKDSIHGIKRSHNCFFTKLKHTIWPQKFSPGH